MNPCVQLHPSLLSSEIVFLFLLQSLSLLFSLLSMPSPLSNQTKSKQSKPTHLFPSHRGVGISKIFYLLNSDLDASRSLANKRSFHLMSFFLPSWERKDTQSQKKLPFPVWGKGREKGSLVGGLALGSLAQRQKPGLGGVLGPEAAAGLCGPLQ